MRVLQTPALPLGHRAFCYSVLADALPNISAQSDRLSNAFPRSPFLLALALQDQEGFVLAESQFPLPNTLAACDELSCFQFHQRVRIPAPSAGRPQPPSKTKLVSGFRFRGLASLSRNFSGRSAELPGYPTAAAATGS
jgi:hypothetical protein